MSHGFRHQAGPLEQQSTARKFWRQRGFVDGTMQRKPAARATLEELGGELALHAYLAGYRSGSLERERRSA